jgi:hypothetical protein
MKGLILLLAAALPLPAESAAGPRIIYTKSFPQSVPAYVRIQVERNGDVTYQEAVDDEDPLKFTLSKSDTDMLFDLAQKLGNFTRPIESGLKVARMGDKTVRWEQGAEHHEVTFNYTIDPDGQAIADGFEKIIETEQDYIALDRTVHFDQLGVNEALLQLETSWDNKRLVAPSQFYPLLNRIVKNESFLHMARERAAKLIEEFQAASASAPAKPGAHP